MAAERSQLFSGARRPWTPLCPDGPDDIAAEHDVTLADVHAALAYYFDHRDEIERQIAEDRRFVEELRQRTPSKLTERLGEVRGHD